MKKFLLFAVFLVLITPFGFSQTDKGIKPEDLPKSINEYIANHYPGHSAISFYKDLENDTVFFAADFTYKKEKYSLLFDLEGNWFETEIQTPFEGLPESVEEAIEKKLKLDFEHFKIIKTQTVDIRGVLLYELEVRGQKNKQSVFNEYFFDRQGNYIKFEVIELKTIPSLF
jgi:hypothetical protein